MITLYLILGAMVGAIIGLPFLLVAIGVRVVVWRIVKHRQRKQLKRLRWSEQ